MEEASRRELLTDAGVARLGQDRHGDLRRVSWYSLRSHRQPADELRDQPVLPIGSSRQALLDHFARILLRLWGGLESPPAEPDPLCWPIRRSITLVEVANGPAAR